jgi:lipopolysaccharide export system protein LptC
MRTSGASLFPLALLGLLAALTFWLEQATQTSGGANDGKNRHDPDFIIDNFKLRRFDPEGTLQHSVVARRMLHYPDDESTDVVEPRMTYHRDPATLITADAANLDKDGKHVKLMGNVQIVRGSGTNIGPTVIATSELNVTPDDEYAITDKPVTITRDASIVTGTGAEVNNKIHSAILFGRVHGTIYKTPVAPAAANNERVQNENPTPVARPVPAPVAKPAAPAASRGKPGVRGKGGQGKTRKSGIRPNHRR